jgi:flagellar hook-associated protein 1 FlgK
MTNSFMGIETITRGLYAQQINQYVIASNLAKTYRDEDGYVIASRQRTDITASAPYYLGTSNGVLAVGTGSQVQQITRLRNLYLDLQIQKQSQIVGRNEVLAEALSQVKEILAGETTLEDSLAGLAEAFTALAADPLNIGLRDDVVNAGKEFADLARQQYYELEQLQLGLNTDIAQTVEDINGLLEEINAINKQIILASSSNANDLLDARDYALTRLSRLLNVQVSLSNQGTAGVYLGGIAIVNSTRIRSTNAYTQSSIP